MVNFNQKSLGYIVRWQSDLVNTKERVISVCYTPYPTKKGIRGGAWTLADLCIVYKPNTTERNFQANKWLNLNKNSIIKQKRVLITSNNILFWKYEI